MEHVVFNFAGTVRYAQMDDREYIVAPMTLIVPGVLSGSKGPLYYPPEEIARNASAWNGIPILVGHPYINGMAVSADDPKILRRQGVGLVMHAQANGKLTAEGWFDVEATRRIDPRILSALSRGRRIELSTGLFTDNEVAPQGATYNGRPYDFIARNYRPDHLAILPDQIGACSIRDGCGVLVNQSPGDNTMDEDDILPMPEPVVPEQKQDPQPDSEDDDVLPMPWMRR
jgi:hypothetical protein